jgi:protease I
MIILFVVAFSNFRDEEYFLPKEILELAGFKIKTASNKIGVAIGSDGGEAKIDFLVSEIKPADFDVVIFIGGSGCLKSLDNEISYDLINRTILAEKILAAICISPIILAKAGVLKGKKATVWTSPMDKSAIEILEHNKAIYRKEPVVIDEKIITASGPSAAEEFSQAIIKVLT